MKIVKILVIVALAYVGLVVLFESLLGFYQPAGGDTMVITSTDPQGNTHDRVVSRLESGGRLYVAANHWPRAWYHRVLEKPQVRVTWGGETLNYVAVPVPVGEEEHRRVDSDHPLGIVVRILTGFPPRYFVRLDPR
jgi:hypothetical protein